MLANSSRLVAPDVVERTVASRAAPTNVARTRRGQEMSKERERRKAFNEGSTKMRVVIPEMRGPQTIGGDIIGGVARGRFPKPHNY